MKIADIISESSYILDNIQEDSSYTYTTEKQILTRIRQILYDRKLSGTESNAGELHRLKQQLKDLRSKKKINENFADGRGPGRPGDSQRHGIPKNATIAQLEKAAKAPGRKGQLARWQLNMRRGRRKAHESQLVEAGDTVFIYERPIKLLFNPGYQRMLAFAKQAEHPRLRALYVPSQDVVVVWQAELGIHHSISVALIEQLGWDLGPDYEQRMLDRKLNDAMHPIGASFDLTLPMVDKSGKPMRDTNMHRRAGDFSVTAFPKFYKTAWWQRIERTAPKRDISEELSAEQRSLAAKLTKLIDHVSLVSMPTVNGGKTFIVDLDQRPIVVVNLNGHTIPFYCSTGRGGKADVATGQWYPFWGIGSDGWFNKGSGDMINNFYYNKILKNTAAQLNQHLGNLVGTKGIPMAGNSAIAVINHNQQPMSYAQARTNVGEYFSGIDSQITKIQGY